MANLRNPAADATSTSRSTIWPLRSLHLSTRVLVWQVVVVAAVSAVWGAAGYPLLFSYAWHKTLHILGAVLFLGNIIVTGLWMSWMARSRHAVTVHQAAQVVNWADVAFTAPGVLLLLTNGQVLATGLGGFAEVPWALWGLVLFGASGALWLTVLLPAQEAMIRSAKQAANTGAALPRSFDAALRRWSIAGGTAILLPLVALALMVLRPGGA